MLRSSSPGSMSISNSRIWLGEAQGIGNDGAGEDIS